MTTRTFIAGDWGTTNLRLALCDADGHVLATAVGRGVAAVAGEFENELHRHTEAWTREHGRVPIAFCGMVGSSLGWIEAPYVPCPATPARIAAKRVEFEAASHPVFIAPGLSCRNRFDSPDYLRGEETQIVGAMALDDALTDGVHLLGLPGTHTKWVVLRNGAVEEFCTTVSGELFAALGDHSVLLRGCGPQRRVSAAGFERGLDRVRETQSADITQLLFETRARQLSAELVRDDAAGFLSGLVVGADVTGASTWLEERPELGKQVTLIGSSELTALYAKACATYGLETTQIDGESRAIAGLRQMISDLWQ